jgi:SAM-dependent methyltransferase
MKVRTSQGAFDAADYWNRRLTTDFSLRGVGHVQFPRYYNRWLYARKQVVLQNALAKIPGGVAEKTVLDIGCGTGFFVERYAAAGARVSAMDISLKSIEELSLRHPQVRFRHGDISGADGAAFEGTFDIINMWDVMYHIVSEEGFQNACRNIAAMSHSGTRFLVTDMLASDRRLEPAPHVVFRTISEYEDTLAPHGFTLVETVPLYRFLNRHYPWPDALTGRLGRLFYHLDCLSRKQVPYNLCFSIWECRRGGT